MTTVMFEGRYRAIRWSDGSATMVCFVSHLMGYNFAHYSGSVTPTGEELRGLTFVENVTDFARVLGLTVNE